MTDSELHSPAIQAVNIFNFVKLIYLFELLKWCILCYYEWTEKYYNVYQSYFKYR